MHPLYNHNSRPVALLRSLHQHAQRQMPRSNYFKSHIYARGEIVVDEYKNVQIPESRKKTISQKANGIFIL